jgi:hypothetical protein
MLKIHYRLSIGLSELIGRLERSIEREGVGLRLRLPVRHCFNRSYLLGELVERLALRVDFGGFTLDDRLGVCKSWSTCPRSTVASAESESVRPPMTKGGH